MNKAIRASLLSGLVFPGLGQISLKRYGRGMVLIAVLAACLFLLVSRAVRDALAVLEQIQMQGDMIDFQTILDLTVRTSAAHTWLYRGALLCAVGCWLFSIVDAWRIGKKEDGLG